MSTAEKTDTTTMVSHPFPWRALAPTELLSDEHDVVDANGSLVAGDVEPDTAKALVDAANTQFALSQLTSITLPGAVYELDAAGEREIQRMVLEPGKIYPLPPGEELHGIPDPRIAALEAALVQVVSKFHEATVEATGEIRMSVEAADDEVRDIVEGLGLAKDLWGNPAEAEAAVSS
ncbi:hypothetical protein [Bosea robiniae]|uniref:Uncharacterized protein n=1 Tax=Bosea robiniae TaxID=1036780 RepID=A0ABY0P477_9HYPH|nr:hypothetical protein [Bosea robiniae]SDH22614.1 hypothetical protein SAMN05421844_107213 [Bosea robiniae]